MNLTQLYRNMAIDAYRNIKSVTWPELYNSKNYLRDIALVELKTRLIWSSTVQPACLALAEFIRKYEGTLMVGDNVPV